MKGYKVKIISILSVFSLIFFLNGCIVYHKVSYKVNLKTPNSGIVTVKAYDMRSNADSQKEFNEDKKNLFQYMLKSKKFLSDQKSQGKAVQSRKLYMQNGKLMGEGSYKFDNIKNVAGINYDEGFHYLNLNLDDSVMATNGEVVRSAGYKRIMWDSTYKVLEFTMFSYSFKNNKSIPLAPYFKPGKN